MGLGFMVWAGFGFKFRGLGPRVAHGSRCLGSRDGASPKRMVG